MIENITTIRMEESLHNLLLKAVNQPDIIDTFDEETVDKARKSINPYAGVLPNANSDVSHAVIGFTNFKDIYLRRLIVTSIIGYVYRCAFEAKPRAKIEEIEKEYVEKMQKTQDEVEKRELQKKQADEIKLACDTYRRIVTSFLDRIFRFNPDLHVRSAHEKGWMTSDLENNVAGGVNSGLGSSVAGVGGIGGSADAERDAAAAIHEAKLRHIAKCAANEEHLFEEKLRSKQDKVFDYSLGVINSTYTHSTQLSNACKKILSNLDPQSDEAASIMKIYEEVSSLREDVKKIAGPMSEFKTSHARTIEPPADVFHHFDRYITNNFEELKDIVEYAYSEKPDIELAVRYYESFGNKEAANAYIDRHAEEFRIPAFSISNEAVVLLGPYKANRERLEYYGKNTSVLREMAKRAEADAKLGQDLMKKTVSTGKAKNLREAGPDDPALKQYVNVCNTARELGMKTVLTSEERDKLEEAIKVKEDLEVPEEAIQMDIFYTSKEGELKKKKMYTQAEAPLHMQEGSEYVDKYQPVRKQGDAMTYRTKKIRAKDGTIREVKVPSNEPVGDDEL